MDIGRATKRRRANKGAREAGMGARSAYSLVPIGVVAVTLGLLLRPALNSPLIAIAVVGMLGLLGLVAALGFDRASNVMMVLAFGFAPLTSFLIAKPFVLASVFFFIAFVLAIPRLASHRLRLPGMFIVGSALFTIMGLLSAPVAISAVVSLVYLVGAAIALIAIPAALAWMAPTNRQMYAMAVAFGIGTAFSTAYGLMNYTYRNQGFTYHPVALGYTAMLTLAFVPFMLASKVRGRWIVVPPVAAVALVGVWTSGSRTGLIVLIALALLIPIMERSAKLGLLVITSVVLLLPTVLSASQSRTSTTALSRLFGNGGARGSDSIRIDTFRDGLQQVQSSPIIGNGYSTEHTYVIHNIYLQVLAAEGLIGFIGLLLIFAALVVPLRNAPAPQRCLAYPALAAIIAGPFQPNMADHYLGMSLGLSLVAAVGVLNSRREPDESAGANNTAMMTPTRV